MRMVHPVAARFRVAVFLSVVSVRILTLNPRIHVNQFAHSLYMRAHHNILDWDFTLVISSFKNAMGVIQDRPHLDASREFAPLCFYDRAHCPTLERIRDNPSVRTLGDVKDPARMTVKSCAEFCIGRHYIYAGVENGEDCCK